MIAIGLRQRPLERVHLRSHAAIGTSFEKFEQFEVLFGSSASDVLVRNRSYLPRSSVYRWAIDSKGSLICAEREVWRRLVSRIVASWNRTAEWLRLVDGLRQVA